MGFSFSRDIFKPVKKVFKKPSIILRPAYKAITQPAFEVAEETFGLAGNLVSTVTSPFLDPIERILDAVSPRFKVGIDLPNPSINLQGGTSHKILIPGLNAPKQLAGESNQSDFTGGILSDLAFSSEYFRGLRGDLNFLQKTMRKGLFPHRDDLFECVFLVQPNLSTNGKQQDIYATVEVTLSDQSPRNLAISLDNKILEAEKPSPNFPMAPPPVWTESMVLPIENGSLLPVNLKVKFLKPDGSPATDAQVLQAVEAVELRINRLNDDLEETLHRFSMSEPSVEFSTAFQVDRREFMTEDSDYFEDSLAKIASEGGGLKSSVDSVKKAIEMIDSFPDSPQALPENNQSEAIIAFLLARVSHSEQIKKLLWEARSDLKSFRPSESKYDYRLRYKARIENLGTKDRFIMFSMKNESHGSGKFAGNTEQSSLKIPAKAVYETTIYPVKGTDDMRSSFHVRSKEHSNEFCLVSIITAYGTDDKQIWASRLEPENATGENQFDHARFTWEITDMASYED